MNLTCDTVLDLISIYKDGAASKSTATAVEEHLKHCPDCRRYYRQYDSINRIAARKQAETFGDIQDNFTKLSASLNLRRTIRIVFLSVCAAITITAAILTFFIKKNK